MTRNEIIAQLDTGMHLIEFTKADGTVRKMLATRDQSLIESYDLILMNKLKKEIPRKENLDTIHVYDLSSKEWRSFRVDRFISLN